MSIWLPEKRSIYTDVNCGVDLKQRLAELNHNDKLLRAFSPTLKLTAAFHNKSENRVNTTLSICCSTVQDPNRC